LTGPPRLSIFDMDRTLTRGGSYSPWLFFWAWHEAPWRLALLPLSLLAGAAYLLKLVSRGRLKEINHYLLMGAESDPARVEVCAENFAEQVMLPRAFADARLRVAAEQAEGRRVVLATASYGFYVRAIARRFGITDVVATGSKRNAAGAILSKLCGENCYGEAKRRMVDAWLLHEAIDAGAADIRFFSDHHSDAPMFALAGEGIAVNPTRKLAAMAAARGWRIENWR
jgi:HAD superfamily hydrolase (TIGR01490 family)